MCKEERKKRAIFCTISLSKHLRKLFTPGKRHFLLAQLRVKALLTYISKLGLIGEETGDRFTELTGIFRVVSLIDAFDLRVCRHLIDHIDIGRVTSVGSCAVDHMNAPLAFGELKSYFSVPAQVCQIHNVLMEYVPLLIAEGYSGDKRISCLLRVIDRIADLPKTDCRFEHPLNIQRQRTACPVNIDCRAGNILLFSFRMLLNQAICIAGGKMLVIEDPYLHVSLSCLVEDNIHVMPPAGSTKILMWSCFHAHGANPALGNPRNLLPDYFFRFTAHPKERKYIILVHAYPPHISLIYRMGRLKLPIPRVVHKGAVALDGVTTVYDRQLQLSSAIYSG